MEKRITGIIRWLERCLKACRSGALESALMDAECARADLERLRVEVWEILQNGRDPRRSGKIACFARTSFRVAFLAFFVVLLSAAPVARFSGENAVLLPPAPPADEGAASLEWVTPDEKTLLVHLRKRLSEGNVFVALPDPAGQSAEKTGRERVAVPVEPKRSASARSVAPGNREIKNDPPAKNDGAVPYDRIIGLIKTGERALRNDAPAIRVDRR